MKFSWKKALVILVFAGCLGLVLAFPKPVVSPLVPTSLGLKQVINGVLEGSDGTYGIVVKNLKTGEYYAQNEDRSFDTASLYKLWVMGAVFDQLESGRLTMDQILSADASFLNQEFGITDDYAEITSGPVSYSVGEALEQMIGISDNYAALLLTDKVGLSEVSSFLAKNGFTRSFVGTGTKLPTTTPAEVALFFEKLYNGQLAAAQSTDKMLAILKSQRLNDDLPKYLPDGTIIAHKTGELEPFIHDAGIVYSESGDYIIVVMSETNSRPQAEERIALISKTVYQYFATKS